MTVQFLNLQSALEHYGQEFTEGKTFGINGKDCIKADGLDFIPNEDGTYEVENPADTIAERATIFQCLEILGLEDSTPEFPEDELYEEEPDEEYEQDEDLGGTGHGDISMSDADPGL